MVAQRQRGVPYANRFSLVQCIPCGAPTETKPRKAGGFEAVMCDTCFDKLKNGAKPLEKPPMCSLCKRTNGTVENRLVGGVKRLLHKSCFERIEKRLIN